MPDTIRHPVNWNHEQFMERTYNLLKHREGIEHIRITSQQGVMAAVTIARYSRTSHGECRDQEDGEKG